MPTVTDAPVPAPVLSRRAWLQRATVLAALGHCTQSAWSRGHAHSTPPQVLMSWNRGAQSQAGLWTPGTPAHGLALPARAHQLLALPRSAQRKGLQALVVARRPGEYLLRMDPVQGKALQWHMMQEDRYLGGHAVLSANGHTFFSTETDAASGQGLIAERDLQSLQTLREFASGGIGPHALLLEPAGTLLVANGGILNLPETGRRKRNVATMSPNLTRLDARSGEVLAQFHLPDPFLSLRHLAIAPNGAIAVALQAEHADPVARQTAPAMALLNAQGFHIAPWLNGIAPSGWDGYAADVCWGGEQFWASAPQAGCLLGWSADGLPLPSLALPGAGALASNGTQCLVAGAHSAVLLGQADQANARYPLSEPWDNHAVLV